MKSKRWRKKCTRICSAFLRLNILPQKFPSDPNCITIPHFPRRRRRRLVECSILCPGLVTSLMCVRTRSMVRKKHDVLALLHEMPDDIDTDDLMSRLSLKIHESLKEGQQIGVTGTPAFLLGSTQGDSAEVKAVTCLIGALPF